MRALIGLFVLTAASCQREGPGGFAGGTLHCGPDTHEDQGVCVHDPWGDAGPDPDLDASPDAGRDCEAVIEAEVGDACETVCDCGADLRWRCRTVHPGGGPIPGGYCVFDCSEGGDVCPGDSICFESVGRLCYDACETRDDCRAEDGYDCLSTAGTFICWHP